jgi:hypothetical protein
VSLAHNSPNQTELLFSNAQRCEQPIAPRHIGRPKLRWEEDIRNNLKGIKVQNWKKLAQDRNAWKGIIEQAKTHIEL